MESEITVSPFTKLQIKFSCSQENNLDYKNCITMNQVGQ